MKQIAVVPPDYAEHGLAQPRGTFDNRVEHRLGIRRRPADDVENFAGRSLMFERFGNFALLRLHLIEQPHILDRDHRLVGEGGDQLDLLVRERVRLCP